MSADYQPIVCDAYDYLEIACMHREPVRIQLHDGSVLDAIASNVYVRDQVEYFEVICVGQTQAIRLDAIATLVSTAEPPRFATAVISPRPAMI